MIYVYTLLRNISDCVKLHTPQEGSEPNIGTASGCDVKSAELVISTDSFSPHLKFDTGEDWIEGWCEVWLVECAPVLAIGIGKETVRRTVNDP